MKKIWEDRAWDDYLYWQTQDKKTLKKIHALIRDIERNDGKPLGQSERLKGRLSGLCSSRIDEKNRLVWFISHDGCLQIASCRGHYEN